MARVQTAAAERATQRERVTDEESERAGRRLTLKEAIESRRKHGKHLLIKSLTSEVELLTDDLTNLGAFVAFIKEFRILPGGYATLNLATNGRDFGVLLQEAALVSQSHNLIVDVYLTPKPQIEDDEDDTDEWGDSPAGKPIRVGPH